MFAHMLSHLSWLCTVDHLVLLYRAVNSMHWRSNKLILRVSDMICVKLMKMLTVLQCLAVVSLDTRVHYSISLFHLPRTPSFPSIIAEEYHMVMLRLHIHDIHHHRGVPHDLFPTIGKRMWKLNNSFFCSITSSSQDPRSH